MRWKTLGSWTLHAALNANGPQKLDGAQLAISPTAAFFWGGGGSESHAPIQKASIVLASAGVCKSSTAAKGSTPTLVFALVNADVCKEELLLQNRVHIQHGEASTPHLSTRMDAPLLPISLTRHQEPPAGNCSVLAVDIAPPCKWKPVGNNHQPPVVAPSSTAREDGQNGLRKPLKAQELEQIHDSDEKHNAPSSTLDFQSVPKMLCSSLPCECQ